MEFNYNQCKDIWQAKDGISGKTFYATRLSYLIKDQGVFYYFAFIRRWGCNCKYMDSGRCGFFSNSGFQIIVSTKFKHASLIFKLLKDASMAFLDLDKLSFPLKASRNWQEGDFFYPLGMKNQAKNQ